MIPYVSVRNVLKNISTRPCCIILSIIYCMTTFNNNYCIKSVSVMNNNCCLLLGYNVDSCLAVTDDIWASLPTTSGRDDIIFSQHLNPATHKHRLSCLFSFKTIVNNITLTESDDLFVYNIILLLNFSTFSIYSLSFCFTLDYLYMF